MHNPSHACIHTLMNTHTYMNPYNLFFSNGSTAASPRPLKCLRGHAEVSGRPRLLPLLPRPPPPPPRKARVRRFLSASRGPPRAAAQRGGAARVLREQQLLGVLGGGRPGGGLRVLGLQALRFHFLVGPAPIGLLRHGRRGESRLKLRRPRRGLPASVIVRGAAAGDQPASSERQRPAVHFTERHGARRRRRRRPVPRLAPGLRPRPARSPRLPQRLAPAPAPGAALRRSALRSRRHGLTLLPARARSQAAARVCRRRRCPSRVLSTPAPPRSGQRPARRGGRAAEPGRVRPSKLRSAGAPPLPRFSAARTHRPANRSPSSGSRAAAAGCRGADARGALSRQAPPHSEPTIKPAERFRPTRPWRRSNGK